ncbi:hypothetical protein TRFO_31953 [Tritrichomonas foetus]|uniref:Right handed beta helix domain-containing protein n=1 Tax=Tritrichomonas foetus TaxID=1144522 RepID=A0A1J4JVI5_9EUKA|nr:hypothetical protein TRFO_31953 [Tritrichomonas foetus]|eukprot:OHT01277.1 hypothetical protein TRFO_31953 [Tritrichomonas foetus]
MNFFLFIFASIQLPLNLSLDFHGGSIKNPSHLIISPMFFQTRHFSFVNLRFYKSLQTSFYLSNQISLKIHNSLFSKFLESVIRSSNYSYQQKCENNRVTNQGTAYFYSVDIDGCTFNSITTTSSSRQGGAIGLQNMDELRINECTFISCSSYQGGAFWIYNCKDLIVTKVTIESCSSLNDGSGGFVVMGSKFFISHVLVSKSYEGSNGGTGIVYIKESEGVFKYTTFNENTAKYMDNVYDLYAYLAFVSCTNIVVNDICFNYASIITGRPFMKMIIQDCSFSESPGVDKLTFPDFQIYDQSSLVVTQNQNNPIGNYRTSFNSTQDDECHMDFYVFNLGIVKPTPTLSLMATPTISPTQSATSSPSFSPTETPFPTVSQTPTESPEGTPFPSETPTLSPTETPTESPTETPTESPTQSPTETPTQSPTETPTETPTKSPTESPTQSPTESPTQSPLETPTQSPTESPTQSPTESPTQSPTESPTQSPLETPTQSPTQSPTETPSHTPSISSIIPPTNTPSLSIYIDTPSANISISDEESYFETPLFVESNSFIPTYFLPDSKETNSISIPTIIIISVIIFIIIITIIIVLIIFCKKERVAYINENTESSVDYELPLLDDFGVDSDDAILLPGQI